MSLVFRGKSIKLYTDVNREFPDSLTPSLQINAYLKIHIMQCFYVSNQHDFHNSTSHFVFLAHAKSVNTYKKIIRDA